MTKNKNSHGTLSVPLGELSLDKEEASDLLDARLKRASVRAAAVRKEPRPANSWAKDAFSDSPAGTMVDPSSGTIVLGELDLEDDGEQLRHGAKGRSSGIVINMPKANKVPLDKESAPRLGAAPHRQAPPRPVSNKVVNDDLRIWFPVAGLIVLIVLGVILAIAL